MSQLFAWGGQSIGVSALASILPKNTQDWSPLEWTGWISLQSKGLKSLLQHHSSKASILQCSPFFTVQLSHPYMTTGKNISLTRWTFVCKVMWMFLKWLKSTTTVSYIFPHFNKYCEFFLTFLTFVISSLLLAVYSDKSKLVTLLRIDHLETTISIINTE